MKINQFIGICVLLWGVQSGASMPTQAQANNIINNGAANSANSFYNLVTNNVVNLTQAQFYGYYTPNFVVQSSDELGKALSAYSADISSKNYVQAQIDLIKLSAGVLRNVNDSSLIGEGGVLTSALDPFGSGNPFFVFDPNSGSLAQQIIELFVNQFIALDSKMGIAGSGSGTNNSSGTDSGSGTDSSSGSGGMSVINKVKDFLAANPEVTASIGLASLYYSKLFICKYVTSSLPFFKCPPDTADDKKAKEYIEENELPEDFDGLAKVMTNGDVSALLNKSNFMRQTIVKELSERLDCTPEQLTKVMGGTNGKNIKSFMEKLKATVEQVKQTKPTASTDDILTEIGKQLTIESVSINDQDILTQRVTTALGEAVLPAAKGGIPAAPEGGIVTGSGAAARTSLNGYENLNLSNTSRGNLSTQLRGTLNNENDLASLRQSLANLRVEIANGRAAGGLTLDEMRNLADASSDAINGYMSEAIDDL